MRQIIIYFTLAAALIAAIVLWQLYTSPAEGDLLQQKYEEIKKDAT